MELQFWVAQTPGAAAALRNASRVRCVRFGTRSNPASQYHQELPVKRSPTSDEASAAEVITCVSQSFRDDEDSSSFMLVVDQRTITGKAKGLQGAGRCCS